MQILKYERFISPLDQGNRDSLVFLSFLLFFYGFHRRWKGLLDVDGELSTSRLKTTPLTMVEALDHYYLPPPPAKGHAG